MSARTIRLLAVAALAVVPLACGGGGSADVPPGEAEVSFKGVESVDGDVGEDAVASLDAMVQFTTALAEAMMPDEVATFLDSDPDGGLKPGDSAGPSKPGLPTCPTITTPVIRTRNIDFTDCGGALEGNVGVMWNQVQRNFAILFQDDFEIGGVDVDGVVTRRRVIGIGDIKGELVVREGAPLRLTFVPEASPVSIISPPTGSATMLMDPLDALQVGVGGSEGALELSFYGAAGVTVDAAEITVQVGGPDGPDADDLPDQPLHWTNDGCICPDSGILQVDVQFELAEIVWIYTVDGQDVTVTCTPDPVVTLSGTLVIDFGTPTPCGEFTATYTPDQTEITVSEASVMSCVNQSGLTDPQKAALGAYFASEVLTPGTDVTVDLAAIRAQIVAGVQRAVADRLPTGLCQPELIDD